jgi:hypothetical protein
MKLLLAFSAFIASLGSYAQQDTLFLKRVSTPSIYHAIFIDTGSYYREQLTNFNFNHWDSVTYSEQMTLLKPAKNHRSTINHFPKKWIPLYRHEGTYYLYKPSDWGYHFRFEMGDSTTIDHGMEGPQPSRIESISFSSPTRASITRINPWEGRQVNIHVIDVARGIAVFTFGPTMYSKKGYQVLMVDAAKATLFPIIVNYCLTDRQPEWEFEKIDFKALMK